MREHESRSHFEGSPDMAAEYYDDGAGPLLDLSYRFGRKKSTLRFRYHYIDYQDDAPYLYDTSGEYQFIAAALGWVF